MQNTMAIFEAKRDAARSVAGALLTLLLLVTAACGASPAQAQGLGVDWRSPDGTFGVVIPTGWQTIDRFVSGSYLLAVGPPPESATRENPQLPVCSVEGRPVVTRQMTQEAINPLVESMLAPLTAQLRPTTVHSSNSEVPNGVAVVSIDIDQQTPRGPTRQMQRMFAVPHASGIMHYQIGCGASGSSYAHADISALRGFLASLTLTPPVRSP